MTVKVDIWHDDDVENPAEYSIFTPVSFSKRHSSFQAPEQFFACKFEDEDGFPCDEFPCDSLDHEYVRDPAVVAILSYSEHGMCQWYRSSGRTSDPWDTVVTAGVLLVKVDDEPDNVRWFNELEEDERLKMIDSFLDEYTDWCNGSCYGFTIRVDRSESCSECHRKLPDEDLDSVGGYIGTDAVEAAAKEALTGLGYDASEVEMNYYWD